ncbi:MAG: exosortase U, partial [Pirellulaceae bacterium]
VAIDYPFLEWHELVNCYSAIGYRLKARDLDSKGYTRDTVFDPVRVVFDYEDRLSAVLYFSEFHADGTSVPPPKHGAGSFWNLRDRFQNAYRLFFQSSERFSATYQTQVFLKHQGELSEEENIALLDLHLATSEILLAEIQRVLAQ